jgi:hypothetical protein
VFRKPPRIKLTVEFRFLAIQTSRYFVLQSDPLELRLTQLGRGSNDTDV